MKLTKALALLGLVLGACEPPAPSPSRTAAAIPPQLPPSAVAAAPVVDRELLRAYAETRRFSRGTPQQITLTADGRSALFLRSGPRTTRQSLFEMDMASGAVRELVTPESLEQGPESLTLEERARRERLHITGSGITSFSLSRDGRTLLATLSGRLYAVDRPTGRPRKIETGPHAALDPQLSPDGTRVAYVEDDDVHVALLDGGSKPRALTEGGTADHPHGLADFAAAEELDRSRGFWWSPDSKSIVYEDSDARGLEHFTIADPSRPDAPAARVAYPRAGTPNAVVRLAIVAVSGPARPLAVEWDRTAMPYLVSVAWSAGSPLTVIVSDRLEKNQSLLAVDARTGKTRELFHDRDEAWVNVGGVGIHGDPSMNRWLPDGSAFVWWSEESGEGRVGLVSAKDSQVKWLTPSGVTVTGLLDVDAKRGVAILETTRDALHYEVSSVPLGGGAVTSIAALDDGAVFGTFGELHDLFCVHEVSLSGTHTVMVRGVDGKVAREIPQVAEAPPPVHFEIEDVGQDRMHVALVRPHGYVAGAKYPLIDAAYGGPHAQVVTLDAQSMVLAQWMADATGALVVAIDAKGTPGRSRAWERALYGKPGDVPIEGHIDAIRELAKRHPEIDLSRVGVYGKSYGGYFSALAALRHADFYSAGVAVAPVTDWRNYDTAYTERYLGLPEANAAGYDHASVLAAAREPTKKGERQAALLIAHGTADDNVYFFHSLQLVDALTKSGRPFRFLPLLGQTHAIASPEAQTAVWLAAAETLGRALAPTAR